MTNASASKDLAPLPLENGRPRVQRLVERLTPLHVELAPPVRDPWKIAVGGLVEYEVEMTVTDLRALGARRFSADFHCVWGWSRPAVPWAGVPTAVLLEAANPSARATHVRFSTADGAYAACVTLDQALDGIFAVELDGVELPAEHGGPVRWLQPDYLWGYKGVKWVASIELLDTMRPGEWEERVGDVEGFVPEGIIQRFGDLRADGGRR
ncbi:MAG: molybdopterin-dependent oxidoreductase [Actinobacteria bacterium]|nr:molybdopterin-dependent oxidoreductase [Actinomycetota bacterium]